MAKLYQSKKYYIKTYGCQANLADSSTMAGILEALGYESIKLTKLYKNDSEEFLDILPKTSILILNTCSVRQKSEDKVYGFGKIISQLKKQKKKVPFIILSGCMVGSATGDRKRIDISILKKKTPWVDLYINPSQVNDLPKFLKDQNILDEWALQKFDNVLENAEPVRDSNEHAFVNISFGCDNFCTYCVVPYSRGKEISRTETEILKEINHLVSKGYKKFTLCGQNVNSWGLDMSEKFDIRSGSDQKLPFADLLRKICKIEGVEKIEFISSNPFDFTDDLIDAIKNPKISNYMHIAVQSGSNAVLQKMNRRHSIEEFIELIQKIKIAKPELELGTDIIVGFPSETDSQFMDTVKLFQTIKFNVAFISMYSPRKGTPAEKFFHDDISLKEKRRRHKVLSDVWKKTKKI